MALLKMGAIVTKLSGKIGGQSFGSGRSGGYLKNIGSYPRSLSSTQSNVLSSFSSTAGLWRSLSAEVRDAWNSSAENFPFINRVGDQRIYSGFNLFVMFNGNLLEAQVPSVLSAPEPLSFSPILDPDFNSDVESLTFQASSVDDSCRYIFLSTRAVSQGRTASGLNFKKIGVFSSAQVVAGVDLISGFVAVYGPLLAGLQVHLRVKAVKTASGQALVSYFSGSTITT